MSEYFSRKDMLIRDAISADLKYIRCLQKQESFALGWIPEQIFERVWQTNPKLARYSGWILLCEVNLQPVGFVFCTPHSQSQYGRIYQLAVQEDARRYEYGTFLADIAHQLVCKHGSGTVLRCAAELPANHFWEMIGWNLIGIIPEGSRVGDSPRVTRRALHKRLRMAANPSQTALFVPTADFALDKAEAK